MSSVMPPLPSVLAPLASYAVLENMMLAGKEPPLAAAWPLGDCCGHAEAATPLNLLAEPPSPDCHRLPVPEVMNIVLVLKSWL